MDTTNENIKECSSVKVCLQVEENVSIYSGEERVDA
jgi:hypothetical protein